MSVVGGSCVKVGRGGSDGSSAGSSVVGGSSADPGLHGFHMVLNGFRFRGCEGSLGVGKERSR